MRLWLELCTRIAKTVRVCAVKRIPSFHQFAIPFGTPRRITPVIETQSFQIPSSLPTSTEVNKTKLRRQRQLPVDIENFVVMNTARATEYFWWISRVQDDGYHATLCRCGQRKQHRCECVKPDCRAVDTNGDYTALASIRINTSSVPTTGRGWLRQNCVVDLLTLIQNSKRFIAVRYSQQISWFDNEAPHNGHVPQCGQGWGCFTRPFWTVE